VKVYFQIGANRNSSISGARLACRIPLARLSGDLAHGQAGPSCFMAARRCAGETGTAFFFRRWALPAGQRNGNSFRKPVPRRLCRHASISAAKPQAKSGQLVALGPQDVLDLADCRWSCGASPSWVRLEGARRRAYIGLRFSPTASPMRGAPPWGWGTNGPTGQPLSAKGRCKKILVPLVTWLLGKRGAALVRNERASPTRYIWTNFWNRAGRMYDEGRFEATASPVVRQIRDWAGGIRS